MSAYGRVSVPVSVPVCLGACTYERVGQKYVCSCALVSRIWVLNKSAYISARGSNLLPEFIPKNLVPKTALQLESWEQKHLVPPCELNKILQFQLDFDFLFAIFIYEIRQAIKDGLSLFGLCPVRT